MTDANGNQAGDMMLLAEADYQNTLTFPGGEKINASAKPEHAGHQEDRLARDGEWQVHDYDQR